MSNSQKPENFSEPVGTVRCRNGEWFGFIPVEVLKNKRVEVGDKLYSSPQTEVQNLELICHTMYQVAGVLLEDAGRFDDEDGQRVLDMLSNLKHDDRVLPFGQGTSLEFWKRDSAAAWDKCEERRLESEKQDELIMELTQALAISAGVLYVLLDEGDDATLGAEIHQLKEAAESILTAMPNEGKSPITYIVEALNKAKGEAG